MKRIYSIYIHIYIHINIFQLLVNTDLVGEYYMHVYIFSAAMYKLTQLTLKLVSI